MSSVRAFRYLFLGLVAFSAGRTFGQHMNAPGNPCTDVSPNSSETICFLDAAKKADTELNAFYAKVRLNLQGPDRDNLVAAQRLWLQFRDANCKAEHELYTGGSAAPMVQAACMEAVTRQRTMELKTMYGWRLDK